MLLSFLPTLLSFLFSVPLFPLSSSFLYPLLVLLPPLSSFLFPPSSTLFFLIILCLLLPLLFSALLTLLSAVPPPPPLFILHPLCSSFLLYQLPLSLSLSPSLTHPLPSSTYLCTSQSLSQSLSFSHSSRSSFFTLLSSLPFCLLPSLSSLCSSVLFGSDPCL